jgi:hypothetical protein
LDDRLADAIAGGIDMGAERARIPLCLAQETRCAVYGCVHSFDGKEGHCQWHNQTDEAEKC